MSKMSVAHMRRTLTPGTRIHIENHFRPAATRDTVVLAKTNTVDLVTEGRGRDGSIVASHLAWPKAHELSGSGNTFELAKNGAPFLTITLVEEN